MVYGASPAPRRRPPPRLLRAERAPQLRLHQVEPLPEDAAVGIRLAAEMLPTWPKRDVLGLSPFMRGETSARQDVRDARASNNFRQVVLGKLVPENERQ